MSAYTLFPSLGSGSPADFVPTQAFHPFSYIYLCEKCSVHGRLKEKGIVYIMNVVFNYPSIFALTVLLNFKRGKTIPGFQ
jgi:hypothetical protein